MDDDGDVADAASPEPPAPPPPHAGAKTNSTAAGASRRNSAARPVAHQTRVVQSRAHFEAEQGRGRGDRGKNAAGGLRPDAEEGVDAEDLVEAGEGSREGAKRGKKKKTPLNQVPLSEGVKNAAISGQQ